MIVTKEWLESGMKSGVGIKKSQCEILGLSYPPLKGWKKKVIGMIITKEQSEAFLELKNKRRLQKAQKIKLFDKNGFAGSDEIQSASKYFISDKEKRIKFTWRFINHFLVPESDYCSAKTIRAKMIKIAKQSTACDKTILFAVIKKMPYREFLKTVYWKTIAENQKRYAGKKCALCGSDKFLNLHHTTYQNHGNEIFHLEDLITVCRDCHKAIHGID